MKDELKQAYLKGFELGRGVEQLDDIALRTAADRFGHWYKQNHE